MAFLITWWCEKPARRRYRRGLALVLTGVAFGAIASLPATAQYSSTGKWGGRDVSTANVKDLPRPRFAAHLEEFKMDLPPGKEIGRVIAVSRAPNGELYLLNFSTYGPYIPEKPEARLPQIVRLSASGNYLGGWGAEAAPTIDGVSQWPSDPDNVEVDAEGKVYVTGWHKDDDAIVVFSPDGKFIRQYGQRGKSEEPEGLNSPPSVYNDIKGRQLIVADGYGAHRIVTLDADTGKVTRIWGAYGKKPAELTEDETFGIPIHKVLMSSDGLLYAADRRKNRVQEFQLVPGGGRFLREVVIAPGTIGMGAAFDIALTPDNKYMYVADGMNMRVWTVDRKTFEVLGWTNAAPEHEGALNLGPHRTPLHRFALLSNGDLLLARGRRGIQRLKYLGVR